MLNKNRQKKKIRKGRILKRIKQDRDRSDDVGEKYPRVALIVRKQKRKKKNVLIVI